MQSFSYSGLAQFSESPPPGSPLYMWILKEEKCALWNLPLENLLLENLPLENLVAKRRRWKQHEQVCSQRCLTIAGAPTTDHLLGCNWFRTRWPAHIWTHIFSIVLYYCNTFVWLERDTIEHIVSWSLFTNGYWPSQELTVYCRRLNWFLTAERVTDHFASQ